jgi:tetratricopeptide (TPR) repeat protein
VVIGEQSDPPDAPESPDPVKQRSMVVKIPATWKQHHAKESCSLRATARDAEGNLFSTEAPDPIVVDIGACLANIGARALALQEKGDAENALKLYAVSAELEKTVLAADEVNLVASKNDFNSGLACLELSFKAAPSDPNLPGYLGKALNEFTDVVKASPRDAQAILLRGLARQLRGDFASAINDYDNVTKINPKMAAVHKLRALALLQSNRPDKTMEAVDAFTEALSLDAGDNRIRKARNAALKLALNPEASKGEIDTRDSAGTFPSASLLIKPRDFLRR